MEYLSEFLGTMILVFLGDSVVANVALKNTKGNGSGFTFVTLGWMVAVAVPVLMFGWIGGAHFNPAVTFGLTIAGLFEWSMLPGYIGAQMGGGFVGAVLVYIFYKQHFDATEDKATKLGVFATGPAIRNAVHNSISEFLATFLLVFAILMALAMAPAGNAAGGLGIAWIILALGTALGGTTGYALNPARDLSPRIAHFLLPIKDKGSSDWGYSWIPTIMPILGGIVAGLLVYALEPSLRPFM
ncbi:MAG: aquaporin family protein [Defluviitaleaceae bacterium]|nr:aquaporin family protein [Defluviitaleaceae bacterium]MCL2203809.1 aquaporin family protein [Defluviitaleaceae bacterium]MCL2239278.1 aquaporin family protein [Defluviitaleaceae bacterium]